MDRRMMYVAIIAVGSPPSPLVVFSTAADERDGPQRRVDVPASSR